MLDRIKIPILSWLLHHANRGCSDKNFYSIKNILLGKYGKFTCYDIQFIEGKKCYCGDGIYSYDWFSGEPIECYRCDGTGWYKRPVWNILSKMQFGKYQFHQPFNRVYKKPENSIPIIKGYIEHQESKYGKISLTALYILFDFNGFLKRYKKSLGLGWRVKWWLPRNYANNIAHLIKKKQNAIPIILLRKKITQIKLKKSRMKRPYNIDLDEGLPF